MNRGERHLVVSFSQPRVADIEAALPALPPAITVAELRADFLEPGEIRSGTWRRLAAAGPVRWVFTWRSPREGGQTPRPPGVWAEALAAGFPWIDVEAGALETGDAEARALPPGRRWVSRHETAPPASPGAVTAAWQRLAAHEGALHKLVFPADRFEVNGWMLDLVRDHVGETGPGTAFAQGWVGHASRVLGYLSGNAATYLAWSGEQATAAGQPTMRRALEVYGLPGLSPDVPVYGVLGNPTRRSRSPELHGIAFRRAGLPALYIPLEAPDPKPVVDWLRQGRLRGISVTAPFKERVVPLLDDLEDPARELGAVNTVWRENGRLRGANTDMEAAGLLVDDWGEPARVRAALLGAGGAAAAVLGALAARRIPTVVFNRDAVRGERLARRWNAEWGGRPERLDPARFSLVVNATPLGAAAPLPESWHRTGWSRTRILDLAYGERDSALRDLAREARAPYVGGLSFLAVQARGQFRRWTGREPDPSWFPVEDPR